MFRSMARNLPFVLLVAACASEGDVSTGDLGDLEGIPEAGQALTDLAACSAGTPATTTVNVTLEAGDVAMLGRSTDGKLTINGFQCGTLSATAVKKVVVTGEAGAQTLIVDYLNGGFAPGSQLNGVGLVVDLLGGTDAFKIRGGKATDSYVFGSTGITVNGDAYLDITVAGAETFVVATGDGNDVFSAAGSATTGGAPFATAVTVYGGIGNDSIRGGSAADVYWGGDGNDTFLAGDVIDGGDEVNGGEGVDVMDYGARGISLVVTVDGTANDGQDTDADDVADELDDVELDVETVKGSTVADTLTGRDDDDLVDTIYGGDGADVIAGLLGADVLYGDGGADTFDEGDVINGGDVLNGGAGVDTVDYSARTADLTVVINALNDDGEVGETDKVMLDVENLLGGTAVDTFTGSAVANLLDGGAGNDVLNGGEGNDELVGGLGNDTLNGNGGNDTFDEGDTINDKDVFNGGAGVDVVDYSARIAALVVVMGGVDESGEATETDTVAADVESLLGGTVGDTLTGSATANTIDGGGGDDTITGAAGNDVLLGGAGADEIHGGLGDDTINGGADAGELYGDDGADVIDGGAAVDTIEGGDGDDIIDGAGDADIVDCGLGDGDILLDATIDTQVDCEL